MAEVAGPVVFCEVRNALAEWCCALAAREASLPVAADTSAGTE